MRTVGVGRIQIHAFHFVNTTSPVHICSCPRSLPSSTCLSQMCFIRSIFSSPLLRAIVAISPPSVALTLLDVHRFAYLATGNFGCTVSLLNSPI